MSEETTKSEWNTITVSITPMARERLEYIKKYLGMNSRSATVGMAINEMYDRLVEKGYQTQLERKLVQDSL